MTSIEACGRPDIDAPWRLSAVELAAAYRSGRLSPVAVLDACLDRARAWQPRVNAFALIDAVAARAAAQASAARWAAGQPLGPLDGVPVSLKDNLHAAGWPTRWGCTAMPDTPQAADELPVARLRAAGAVLFGKTTLPEFAMQGFTRNDLTGTTGNPWAPGLTPGGSSGGAAAAVAAGAGPLALATDGGGSTRRPASHTGLVGFKPSESAVPRGGGLPELFLQFEVVGMLGRTVDDVALLAQATAGPAGARFTAASRPGPIRILHVPRFGSHPVDPGIAECVAACARQWQALGHTVETAAEPFVLNEAIHRLWPSLSAIGLAWMLDRPSDDRTLSADLRDTARWTAASREALQRGRALPASAMFELVHAVQLLRGQLAALFCRHDLLLTPATAARPWPADQSHPARIDGRPVEGRGHAVFTALANAGGLPAVALPGGFVDGLPTGFQLIGPPDADGLLLGLARDWEAASPWRQHWPS